MRSAGASKVRYDFKGENTRDLPLHHRRAADLLQGLLRQQISPNRPSSRRWAPAPIRSAASSRASMWPMCRRPDYWAKDLPVNRGRYNFDEVRFEYFRDRTAGFEALKAGSSISRRISRRDLGHRLCHSAAQGRPPDQGRASGRNALGRAGLLHQSAGARNSRISGCARRSISPSISNGPTQSLLRPL